MQSAFLSYKNSRIHFTHSSKGRIPLICFHGYGESTNSFAFLESNLPEELKLICVDLPYHGETEWKDGMDFEINDLLAIVENIITELRIYEKKFLLMGFSLGGRMSFQLLQEMPERVNKLVLLAPDGMKLNFWYWLATQTAVGNRLFKLTMEHPGWFLGFLNMIHRLKLVNPSIYKFVKYYIHDDRVRKELYERWTSMRKCKPRLTSIKEHISNYKIPVRLLYGNHDRIILPSPAMRFIDGLNTAKIKMLNCGHQVLHPKNASEIVDALIN